jgi:uncharacterized membrane protein
MWPPVDDQHCFHRVLGSFAFGDTRTMQQDIAFGIMQMVDIALRALSPGVNDPNTANDLIVHIGGVLLALWERPMQADICRHDGRTLLRTELTHQDHLNAAFDPLRLHGTGDPDVAATMIRTLDTLRSEAARRSLPGPIEPVTAAMSRILAAVDATDLSAYDKDRVHALVPDLDASYR